jgi:hypothetical protein
VPFSAAKRHFVSDLDFVEQSGIGDLEHHGHLRHGNALDFTLPQGDLLLATSLLRTSPTTSSVDTAVAVAKAAPATGAAVLLVV